VAKRGRAAGSGITVPLRSTEVEVKFPVVPVRVSRKNVAVPTSVSPLGEGLSGCQVTLIVHEDTIAEQPGAGEVVNRSGTVGLVAVAIATNVFPELRPIVTSNGSVTELPTVTVPKSKLIGEAVIVSAAAGVRVRTVKEKSTAVEADNTPSRWFLI
jgi:hypothetical protein